MSIAGKMPGVSQVIGEGAESYRQLTIAQAKLPGSASIRASADNLILVWRLPGGDHNLDLMPKATPVTSRQSSLAAVAYARLFSTVGRTYSVNDVLLRSGYPKRQIILLTV